MPPTAAVRPTRLGQLAVPARIVPGTATGEAVERLFLTEPELSSVVVARDDGGRDVLTRSGFLSGLAGRLGYGRALYSRRPVALLSRESPALVLGADALLVDAGRAALRRPAVRRYDDLLVALPDGGIGIVSFRRLLAELAELHAERAVRDALTGLPNRELVLGRLAEVLADDGAAGRACLLFIDVDDFKAVNDSLGHPTGDEVLVAVAGRLRSAFRDRDVVARIGGDEFVVLLTVADEAEARAAADRVLLALSAPLPVGEHALPVLASVGVALRGAETRPEELLRAADLAMYEAKRAGKGRVAAYRPALHAEAVKRLELRAALPSAVEGGQLAVVYQPIVDLTTNALQGVEALVRWRHPVRGVVSPADFIPVAEETGAIAGIGAFVLETALRQLREWEPALPGLVMGVNVSVRELDRDGYAARVATALAETGVAPERLTLEVTETALVRDSGTAVRTLHELDELGVRIAIDDFGTGLSSLARLAELPIGLIKLDKRFVTPLAHQPDGGLIRGLLGLAEAMGVRALAEGIEEPAQLEALRALGCGLGQGYLLSRPLQAQDVLGWAASEAALS